MDYRPLNNNILALPLEADEVTPGGLFIPEQARKTLNEATVIACGPEVPDALQPGNTIVFTQHSETRIKVEGKHYVVVESTNVMLFKVAGAQSD